MSIYRVNQGDIEQFTIVTNPSRQYTSSSLYGVTGSVNVFARRSEIERDNSITSAFIDVQHDDVDITSALSSLQSVAKSARLVTSSSMSGSFSGMMSDYMDRVNRSAVSLRKSKVLNVKRFTPTTSFTESTVKKLFIKDVLSSYYRTTCPSAHWAYTNYNSLNFFTSSAVPTGSVLLYPNIPGTQSKPGFVSGTYSVSGAFSFDFYVNPRHRQSQANAGFKAGTIMHLSSCYSLSLVTGSAKDQNGFPVGFRLLLQLSHSADSPPSLATKGTYPNDLIFLSNDNALTFNSWQHVVIRWGTSDINAGTGSFNIDGIDKGTFVIPSSTIIPRTFAAGGVSSPDVLCVGNYYEGQNRSTSSLSYFFATDPSTREGLQELNTVANVDEPSSFNFRHPLNAEIHDLSLKRYYMSDLDIETSSSVGPKSIDDSIAFYLPPFFVSDAPFRKFVGTKGGVPQTPFQEADGTTNDPFNVAMSFGVAGHYVNIENFLRDFASNVFPRALEMSASIITNTSQVRTANEFLYDQPGVRRRNTLLMPCDDGLFVPSYELLASESNGSAYVDDLGIEELSFIDLNNLVSTSSILFGTSFDSSDKTQEQSNSFVNESIGFTPEQPGLVAGNAFTNYISKIRSAEASGTLDAGIADFAPLAVYQRTLDPSSNQVTFFDMSNLFYGNRILPGSLTITDNSLSGSGDGISITLKDDGRGTLYRADSFTSASTWNSVGSVFYDEGLIAIKSPHLYFFGKEGFDFKFKGEQNVHVMKLDVLAPANQMNSSSNPDFKAVPPSPFPNDPDKEFVYITGINFHDDNFNVIMKTQLAQPIMKRTGERILFRTKIDF